MAALSETAPDIHKVSVLGKESIHCGFHLIPYISSTVLRTLPASTYVLVTDTHVAKLHLTAFEEAFSGSRFLTHVIPPGETSKSRQGKTDIEDFLLANTCTRDTVILALGGGVIGDLVGFVAATFMRGVRFVQIPTTLLAMVDSSVGGKTAIDTPHGKNLIGAFWQPEYVFIDAAFLETLPSREFANGMAEVVKTAAIWNETEFASLESGSADIISAIQTPSTSFAGRHIATRTPAQSLLLSVIVGSISVKAHIVTIDERETGLRNLVNFGHTIGHAIEAVLTPGALHGECVSVGIILEAEVARQIGILAQGAVGRLTRCLASYNLPVSLTDPRLASLPAARGLSVGRLLDIMRIDKKNSGSEKKIVLLSRIGATHEPRATGVADDVIRKTLSSAVRVVPGIPSKNPVTMATPGSKSISNRALVLAALAKGTCRLTNLLHSDDTQVMMNALIELQGAKFSWEDNGETLVVEGGEGRLRPPRNNKHLYLGNAGTAARFLTTVCTLVKQDQTPETATVITGNARMKQRPVGPLVDALRANGSSVDFLESQGCLPLAIGTGGFKGGRIRLAASVSSQYVSSILLCAPYAAEPVVLELTGGAVISQPYINMTIAMMREFGVSVTRDTDPETGKPLGVYQIPSATYVNPGDYSIESDASSATYPLAIAAITGTTCTIPNIGSASLQGDAGFAKGVLEPMGCKVVQTATSTTVTGPPPGQLRAIGRVDMEPMTDAFLTASVLAAVATLPPLPGRELRDGSTPNTTRIIGIANQRVKECNRIRAMIDELAKFGVETKELDDGLEVYGKSVSGLREGVSVHCYDDHRVAMAFSVLAAVIRGTILEEKRCVEKTWPNWWDDLQNKIGIQVEGVELAPSSDAHAGPSSSSPPEYDPSASIVLVGMRGAGKTHIGNLAASALDRKFLDADAYFEEKHAKVISVFVRENGWDAFRAAEKAIFDEILETNPTGHVISSGGGIVETPAARESLVAWGKSRGPVVHISRDIGEIVRYLGEETARPAYGESVEDVFKRRQPWYDQVSAHKFTNDVGAATRTEEEVARFFKDITGTNSEPATSPASDKRTYFLSLTYPDITKSFSVLDDVTTGVDAVELRVDLLTLSGDPAIPGSVPPPVEYVASQLASLREHTPLPIVFTVRTVSQGGVFPDDEEEKAFALFDLALRTGCEYVDVEISWPESRIKALASRKGSSQIIASWHDWSGDMKWDGAVVKEKYVLASKLGDIVKIVGKATTIEDNFALHNFATSVARKPGAKPLIAINMGLEGQLSRILNPTLSPVSHPLLPTRAAPGQLSFAEIQSALHLIGKLPAKKFYLFGSPIAYSMSPTIHNMGFEVLGLPHHYSLLETPGVDDKIRAALKSEEFGGASVTIPHKLAIIPLLDSVSPHAQAIGAINTIIPRAKPDGSRELFGDNTDWLAIRECVRKNIKNINGQTTALVIGAGGTSRAAIYALHDLGINTIYLFNRTIASAHSLARVFPDYGIAVVDTLEAFPGSSPSVIISTVPAFATTSTPGNDGTLLLPASIFSSEEGGVVIDMAYKPAETPLLRLAKQVSNWVAIPGLAILLEQGYLQFEAWTGRRAPRSLIEKTVWEKYQSNN
ncbi:hypothetical protein BOTBODRAFT_156573 [Botryobasidium botryosum FD-172 SS1]|uniref:Pentafunctional AROM polypeptide n=1 Tax=Botryobasidium botryosum (strain FD-172 SS1) TaxID=930990 RepID=A0A067MYN0_BOTB1|nr:hypothetical protein BOTBODRAFT_156573 [Botryobasidium botryosum FD-172 SS1]